jgi:hypothetical protein
MRSNPTNTRNKASSIIYYPFRLFIKWVIEEVITIIAISPPAQMNPAIAKPSPKFCILITLAIIFIIYYTLTIMES